MVAEMGEAMHGLDNMGFKLSVLTAVPEYSICLQKAPVLTSQYDAIP